MQGASSVRALVLVAIAAAFCAAFTPHGTKPLVPVTAEANQPETCPPQWLPVLLGFTSGQVDSPKSPIDGDRALFTDPLSQSVDKALKAAGGVMSEVMCSLLGQCDPAPPAPTSTWQCNPQDGSVSQNGEIVDASVPCNWGLTSGPSSQQAEATAGTRCKGAETLAAIQKEEVHRNELQLVVVRHTEDISWSDPFAAVRTVYEKAGPVLATLPPTPRPAAAAAPNAASVVLPNVGKEQHAYLTHIVRNYDSLAERTVFMHGRSPTCGFFMVDANQMGNHLLTNVSVLDYVQSEGDLYMPLTGRANQNLTLASIRSTFADGLSPRPRVSRPVPAYPIYGADQESKAEEGGGDRWLKWERNDLSRHAKQVTLQQGVLSAVDEMIDFGTFFQRVIGRPPPVVLYFAHGAQFAASRAALRSTSKETYQWILELVEAGHFEVTYYLEMIWLYVLHGAPETDWDAAAADLDKAAPYLDHLAGARKLFEADTAKSGASERRSLQQPDPSPDPEPSCLDGPAYWLCYAACHHDQDPIACKNECPPFCCQAGETLWECIGGCHQADNVAECKEDCYSKGPVCPTWWYELKERISGSGQETDASLVTVLDTAAEPDASLVIVEAALAQTTAYHRKPEPKPKPKPTPNPEDAPMPPPSPPSPSPKSKDTPMPPPLPPSPSPKSEDAPMPPPLPPPPARATPKFNCYTRGGAPWSAEKSKWCCRHRKIGCLPPPLFDCRTKEMWSDKKRVWCCRHEQLGCQPPPPPPSPSPCKPDPEAFCFELWAPVCGPDGKTYSNKCMARAACQLDGSTEGECLSPSPSPSPSPPCKPNPRPVCPMLWNPVCGPDGKTYSNPCLAKAACKLIGSKRGPCKKFNCYKRELWSDEKSMWCCKYMRLGCKG